MCINNTGAADVSRLSLFAAPIITTLLEKCESVCRLHFHLIVPLLPSLSLFISPLAEVA